ncbi:hypothetical protein AMJ39_09850 [candidate division TA06 bacterium DG_24]|uniref:Uncharacterized protein n=1 Tax=candidate division TA06 bacterium DG_24 TaxID=1703770 RepID=A0A0S7WMX2_UNCT6|nr:MAG: hypothetical protein AMJ39_09850 [candidate division TA06 bacterium DG_24]
MVNPGSTTRPTERTGSSRTNFPPVDRPADQNVPHRSADEIGVIPSLILYLVDLGGDDLTEDAEPGGVWTCHHDLLRGYE